MMSKFFIQTILAVSLGALALPSTVEAQSAASPYTSSMRYDVMGRVAGTIAPDPDGTGPLKHAATRTTYDARGNVTKVETGELSSWQNESIAPANWGSAFTVLSSAETTYDTLNRKVTDRAKDSNGSTISLTQYSYDNLGRLECTATRMNPAAYGSLPASACSLGTQGSNGPDRITKTVYDAAGQVLQVRKAVGTSIEIADVTYSYTPNGKIEQIVDANGNRAELRYDGHDRQERWVFPSKTGPSSFNNATPATVMSSAGSLNESDYESYTYDANGNRLSLRKRDGWVINYQYDNLNRMTKKDLPVRADLPANHRRDVYYTYDLRGLQIKARFNYANGLGVTYSYDGFGRVLWEGQSSDTNVRTVYSQYDKNGNRTRVTHPDGQYWSFDYDGLNRQTNIGVGSTTFGGFSYNNRAQVAALDWTYLSLSNNKTTYGYDNAGRLDQIGLNIHYGTNDVTWDYTRNPASQILTETQSNDAYSWDGHVNLTRNYTTNGLNQYTAAGSANFCYDANGNLISDGTSMYLYDFENRLVERRVQPNATTPCANLAYTGDLLAQLRYDPLGRLYMVVRYLNNVVQGSTRFLYDGNAMVAEYSGGGTMQRRYVHGSNVDADDPLIWYEGASTSLASKRYLHSDPRGSIVSVTEHRGAPIAINTYDEYGIPDTASGDDIATKGRFRYTGQAWIPELGMYYYKARIYSPTLGRFLQTDPIGYEDQFNLYAYVANDPINGIDPTGMNCDAKVDNGCGQGDQPAEEEENVIYVFGEKTKKVLEDSAFRLYQGAGGDILRASAYVGETLAWGLHGQFSGEKLPKFGTSSGVTGQLVNMLGDGVLSVNSAGSTGNVDLTGSGTSAETDWNALVKASGAIPTTVQTPLGPVQKIELPGGGTASIRKFGNTHSGTTIQVSKRPDMPQPRMKFRY